METILIPATAPAVRQSTHRRSLLELAAAILMVATIAAGLMLATASPANASTTQCGNGRCTVYLSKAETQAMAQGRAPAISPAAPWQLKASYYALVQGHRFFAQQYANRGWCSAFQLSVRPWDSQGYTGYRC